jgi:hypothetical protein
VLVDLVPQTSVPNLIQAEKLVQAPCASVRHEQSVKAYGESSFAEGLNGTCLAENSGTGRDEDMLATVRVQPTHQRKSDLCDR